MVREMEDVWDLSIVEDSNWSRKMTMTRKTRVRIDYRTGPNSNQGQHQTKCMVVRHLIVFGEVPHLAGTADVVSHQNRACASQDQE